MKPRTLRIDTPFIKLAREISHTYALLHAYPFLEAQAAEINTLYPEWTELLQQELALMRELLEAEARTVVVDDHLDFLCMAISATLLAENGNNRKAPLYQRYFGSLSPSKLKRPVLGQQLDVMRTWIPSLTGPESSPALQKYGKELAERVAEADTAIEKLSEAERKLADFEIGPRKAFVDRLNAVRLSIYGQVAELPHKRPELKLPRDFAHRFFLRGRGSRKPTIADVEQDILRQRNRLSKLEALLAELIEEEEREAALRDDAELRAIEEELAAIEAQREEAAARLAEARARRAGTE